MPLTRAMWKRRRERSSSVSEKEDENERETTKSSCEDEDEKGALVEPSQNPLLNELILSNLFEYMDYEALKACRLVSKKWNILTIPFARSRFKVKIYGHESNPFIQACPVRINTIESFMELIRSNTLGIQFENFALAPIDTTIDVGQEFLSRFGKGMKSLDLQVTAGVHMVEDIRAILQSTPNLEYFGMPGGMCSKRGNESVVKLLPPKLTFLKTFDLRMEDAAGRRKNCPTFLEELFTAAENISNVYFQNYDYSLNPTRSTSTTLEVLQVLENLGRESTLENFVIPRVCPAILTALKRMASNGLRLKHLKILEGQLSMSMKLELDIYETGTEWLEIIGLFAETLITLDMCYRNTGSRSTELPLMPQLKKLVLRIKYSHPTVNRDLRCERMNFMNTFPALESLSMICKETHYNSQHLVPEFFNDDDICPNMKILSLRDGFNLTTNQTLEHALKIFPNLYELELKIESAELLQHIWVHMSGLEKLHLYGKLDNERAKDIHLDSLFTGITTQEIKKMGNPEKYFQSFHLMSPGERRQTLQTLVERHRTLPSISNLTSLRFLSLSIPDDGLTRWDWKYSISKHMTDLTGYLGLYFLKNLQELRVWKCEFSRTCTKILIEDIGLQSWNFKQIVKEDMTDYVRSNKKPYNGIQHD